MRAKQLKTLQAGQGGFTLLELLVVITLIAVLATGALIAYENLGENAEASAAANSAATIDRAIRTYRSVEGVYPNQWDSLALNDGTDTAIPFLADATRSFIAGMQLDTTSVAGKRIIDALARAGINELQTITTATALPPEVAPNRAHNESTYGDAAEIELYDDDDQVYDTAPAYISVIPVGAQTLNDTDPCPNIESFALPQTPYDGSTIVGNEIQNRYADAMEGDECHLVVALGFGGDAAASTAFSNVGISQSPTYINNNPNDADNNINPTQHYARFIGLFHVAEYDENEGKWKYNEKARLVALVSPDGKNIDQLVANSQQQTN
jgi:prepilin-type N-terminal cleavage/methylation domain-containing protein